MSSLAFPPSPNYRFAMSCIEARDEGLEWFRQFKEPEDETLIALIKGLAYNQGVSVDADSVAHYIFGELRDDGSNDLDAWLDFQAQNPEEAARQKNEIEAEVARREKIDG